MVEAIIVDYNKIDLLSDAKFLKEYFKQKATQKVVIEKCPSTVDAFNLINKQVFKSAFECNENTIAVVLKINELLNEHEADNVRSLELHDPQPLLIAFESVNKLMVYWRTKDMNYFLKVVLDRIKDGDKLLNVPTDVLIDSFLIKCIEVNDNGLRSTCDAEKYQNSSIPLDQLYNSTGCNLLMVSLNENDRNAFEYFSKSISDLKFCPDKGYRQSSKSDKLKEKKTIQTFNMSYLSNPPTIISKMKENASYEKIVIEKCPSTADALKMIERPIFREPFKSNSNAIAIVLKIDSTLDEEQAKRIQLLNLDAPKPRPLLIAFESAVDGSCVVFWRTRNMKELLSTRLERIQIREDLFFPVHTSVSSILIDSFLIPSIKSGHTCTNPNFNLEKCTNSLVPLHCLYNSEEFNLLMVSVEEEDENAVDYFLKTKIDVNYSIEKCVESSKGLSTSKKMRKSITYNAANIANKSKNSNILLKLLQNNSLFPDYFELHSTSSKITDLYKENLNFHELIKMRSVRGCEGFIKNHPGMKYFFDIENNSAAYVALKYKNMLIYELLAKNSIQVAVHETLSLLFYDLEKFERNVFCGINEKYSIPLTDSEILSLISKTELSPDNTNIPNPLSHIEGSYKYLFTLKETNILLKLIAAHGKFYIYPDFNRSSTQFLRGKEDDAEEGVFLFAGKVYIGVKEICDAKKRFEVNGTMGHEFGHFGLFIVFRNDGKPYSFGDVETEKRFEEIMRVCEKKIDECNRERERMNEEAKVSKSEEDCENENKEDKDDRVEKYVSWVFENYPPELWPAELIVRVPHMTAAYKNDPEKLNKCRKDFKDLFDFYELEVLPKLHEALPFIKTLSKEDISIKWTDLPSSLRVTCMNRKLIMFQGEIVSLFDIAGFDEGTIFDCLSSDAIRDLIEGKSIDVGQELEEIKIYVKRKFVHKDGSSEKIFNKKFERYEVVYMDVWDANELASTERLVLLSDEAGAGKTTTFKYLSKMFKENYPSDWVLYVDLKKHFKVYEEFKGSSLNAFGILVKIQELKDWSLTVFKELFDSDRVIVFWDGLDEISPNYKKFMTKILKDFKESSSNMQWISSRPQHIEHLEGIFQISAYKLVPYSKENREEFFRKYLPDKMLKNLNFIAKIAEKVISIEDGIWFNEEIANHPLMLAMLNDIYIQLTIKLAKISGIVNSIKESCSFQDEDCKMLPYTSKGRMNFIKNCLTESTGKILKIDEIIEKIEKFIEFIENKKFYSYQNVSNPLMINMFADIFSQSNLDFNSLSNQFSIFDKFIDMKLEDLTKKGKIVQKGTNKSNKNAEFKKVHQKFALNMLFSKYFDNFKLDFPISTPSLVNKKSKLSFTEISRFGILQIANEENFNFVHRSFAEFFVAQYLIDNLYDLDPDEIARKEIIKRLQLLFHVAFYTNCNVIRKFIGDFIESNEEESCSAECESVISKLIQDKFKYLSFRCSMHLKFNFPAISFASMFFAHNRNFLNFVLNLNESETNFVKFAKSFGNAEQVQQLIKIFTRHFQIKVLAQILFGRDQRGNILWNIHLNKAEIFESNSKLKSSYFYAENYNSDILLPKISKLGDSFLDFFTLVEKHLTVDELKELFIRNPASIFHKNHKSLNYLKKVWSKAENILSKKEEMKKMLLAVEFEYHKHNVVFPLSVLSECLQMWNESCTAFILDKYRKCFNKRAILDFFLFLHKLSNVNLLRFAMKNPNEKVCEELWKLIKDVGFTDEEQKNFLKQSSVSGKSAFGTSMWIQNEKTFEIMKAHMQSLYTFDQIRGIVWKERKFLIKDIIEDGSIEVCRSVCEYISELFANNMDKLREIVRDDIRYGEYDTNERYRCSIVAKKLKVSFEDFFISLNEIVMKFNENVSNERVQLKFELEIRKFTEESMKFYSFDLTQYFIESPWFAKILAEIFLNSESVKSFTNFYSFLDEYVKTRMSLFKSEERFDKTLKHKQNRVVKCMSNDTLSLNFGDIQDVTRQEIFEFTLPPFKNTGDDFSIFEHFLVAKYLIDNIYNSKSKVSENDIELLIRVAKYKDYQLTYEIVLNFIESEKVKQNFHESFSSLMKSDKYRKIFISEEKGHSNLVLFLSKFVAKDEDILRTLWAIDENKTFLIRSFLNKIDELTLNNFFTLTFLMSACKAFFNSADVLKLFRGRNQSKLIVYTFWRKLHNEHDSWSFLIVSKFLKISHPELSSKILDIRECKNEEEIVKFIEENLSPLTDEERKYFSSKQITLLDFYNAVEFEKYLKYLMENCENELKDYFELNLQDLFNYARERDEKFLKILIDAFEVCFTESKLKNIFIKNSQKSKCTIFYKYSFYSNETKFAIFWQFVEKFLKSKDDRRQVLDKSKFYPETHLYSALLNKDSKIFPFVKQIYVENFTKQEIQKFILQWNETNEPILFRLILYQNLQRFQEFMTFLTEIFEGNELKSFVLAKNKWQENKTIFQHFVQDEFEEKLKLLLPLTQDTVENY